MKTGARSIDGLVLVCFTVLFFASSIFLAARKPFWTDELLSLTAAQTPALRDLLTQEGSLDSMPPLTPLLMRLSMAAFGVNHVSARLPAILGYWLMCVSVFALLRRRLSLGLATVGLLMPVAVPMCYGYAIEARGYGALMGFAGLALLCWDLAEVPRARLWACAGLASALAAAMASHLYGVLLVAPLALAEAVRTLERGRSDRAVWLAFGLGLLMLVPLLPAVLQARTVAAQFAGTGTRFQPALAATLEFFQSSPTFLGLFVLVCASCRAGQEFDDAAPGRAPLPASVWLAVASMAALPLLAFLISLVTTVYVPRYVAPAVVGLSLLVPLLLDRLQRVQPGRTWWFVSWLAAMALLGLWQTKYQLHELSNVEAGVGPDYLLRIQQRLPADDLPIVVSDFHVFNRLRYYASDNVRARLFHLSDTNQAIHALATRRPDKFPQVAGLAQFVDKHRQFYLYVPNERGELLLPRLIEEGGLVRDVGLNDTSARSPLGFLLKVEMPEK